MSVAMQASYPPVIVGPGVRPASFARDGRKICVCVLVPRKSLTFAAVYDLLHIARTGGTRNAMIRIRPLTPDRWPAFEALFGRSGASNGCWCATRARSRLEAAHRSTPPSAAG
jgi:hypothetical protein